MTDPTYSVVTTNANATKAVLAYESASYYMYILLLLCKEKVALEDINRNFTEKCLEIFRVYQSILKY